MNFRMFTFLFCVLIFFSCGEKKKTLAPPPPQVSYITVHPERIVLTEELPARIKAFLTAEIRPQISGIIKTQLFTEGTNVKKGDVLYEIDDASYKATYANAEAALKRSQANLPSLRSKVERYKELVEINAISRQEYDDVLAALRQVEADIEYYKATLENARINLENTRIKAPIDGRIGKSNVTVGALVVAYQQNPLATIQQLDPIYVDATQSSAAWLRLKRQIDSGIIKMVNPKTASVRLILEDGTLYPLKGELKFSDVTVDPTTGSFVLRTVFPNPDYVLLPGTYVRVIVEEGIIDRAILIPQSAVQRDIKGRPIVMIVDDEGNVEQRLVGLDRTIGDKWLVLEGLKPKDKIVVEGFQKIRAGIKVKAVPFSSEKK